MRTARKRRQRESAFSKAPTLPKPVTLKADKREGFSLRTINAADRRFAAVRLMKVRVDDLMEETGGYGSLRKQFLVGRAVYLVSYLESLERDAIESHILDLDSYFKGVESLARVMTLLDTKYPIKKGAR